MMMNDEEIINSFLIKKKIKNGDYNGMFNFFNEVIDSLKLFENFKFIIHSLEMRENFQKSNEKNEAAIINLIRNGPAESQENFVLLFKQNHEIYKQQLNSDAAYLIDQLNLPCKLVDNKSIKVLHFVIFYLKSKNLLNKEYCF